MAKIMVIGAGVVGGATGNGFAHHGHDVTFVDVNQQILKTWRDQDFNAIHPDDVDLNAADFVFVSVTALTGEHGIDLTHLLTATRNLGEKLAAVTDSRPVIVYRCTMPPGTMRKIIAPLLEESSGRKAGVDFGIVYNPEFLRAETAAEDFLAPRAIALASFDEQNEAFRTTQNLMRSFKAPIYWLTLEQAELLKYVNNVGNAVKITFFNFMRLVAAKLEIDTEIVFRLSTLTAEGLWNPTYGTRNQGAFGGVCLPKDTEALRYFAQELGVDVALLTAVQAINEAIQKER